jgi:hypothetical protein
MSADFKNSIPQNELQMAVALVRIGKAASAAAPSKAPSVIM